MLCFRRVAPPALGALLLVALPGLSFAADAVAPAAKTANGQAKEQPKDQAKGQAKQEATKEQAKSSDVVERVNGKAITKAELDRAVKVMLAQNQVPQPVSADVMKQATDAALDQLTAAELLYQEGAKVEIKDLDKQVAEKVALSKAKFSSDEEFDKALKSVDMTLKDMQELTRRDIVISNYIDTKFVANAAVTDVEAAKFYDDNREKYFNKPETVRASHILVAADEKMSAEDRKKAKEKADAILKRVKGGEDFAAIAKAESSCPSSAQGGDLGSFSRGQMVPAFDKAAFSMKPGEISDIVETQFGYHVIKVTEHQEASVVQFDEVKPKIIEYLTKQKVQKDLLQHVADLKKTAKIETPEQKPEQKQEQKKP